MSLLTIHILAGGLSLLAAALAVGASKGSWLHIGAGRCFFAATAVIFVTALPLALVKNNVFLFLISIFSFYMAFAGWRFARNVSGTASLVDWLAVLTLLAGGVGMWVLAVQFYQSENAQYVVLVGFGFIALALGLNDVKIFKSAEVVGKKRVIRHLTNMLGAMIAVITAFLVVNVDLSPDVPSWVIWMLPTMLITPYIAWWNIKLRREIEAKGN